MRAHLPVLPVLWPMLAALITPVAALVSRRAAWPLACLGGLLSAASAIWGAATVVREGALRYTLGGWPPPWGIEAVLDPLSAFTAATLATVAAVALVASGPAVRETMGGGSAAFYALALLTLSGLMGLVVSGDLFNVFVFLEVAGIASYALVASGGGPALAAAFRYLLLGSVGASFYLLGVGFLYALTGTLNMADLARRLPAVADSPTFAGGVIFVVVGLAIKMGLFPLHGWLPDAYTHAPAPVATFLAPVATKAAAYALARLLLFVLRPGEWPVSGLVAWAGGAAILAGGILALRQSDGRRLLAYSSVSQMGYIALGIGLATPQALVGAYLHLLNHALMKAILFLAAGVAAASGRGVAVGALDRSLPVSATASVVAALSMVGIPPAGGFFSKWYVLRGAVEAREPLLAAAVLSGSLLAVVYMYRFTEQVWFGKAGPPGVGGEAPPVVLWSLAALAVGVVAAGLASVPLVTALLEPVAAGR